MRNECANYVVRKLILAIEPFAKDVETNRASGVPGLRVSLFVGQRTNQNTEDVIIRTGRHKSVEAVFPQAFREDHGDAFFDRAHLEIKGTLAGFGKQRRLWFNGCRWSGFENRNGSDDLDFLGRRGE